MSSTIFLQTIDKEEIANIIFSLNSNKASGLNRIPSTILFLLKNKISKQLADLLNLTFMTAVFPSVLKTAEVVPFLIEIQNYIKATIAQSPCYQILKKYLKSLCIRNCIPYTFLIRITYFKLQFGFGQQYSISHALINITENLRKALNDENIGCGVFADLQKAFDIVSKILIPDTVSKIESLRDSRSFKLLV